MKAVSRTRVKIVTTVAIILVACAALREALGLLAP